MHCAISIRALGVTVLGRNPQASGIYSRIANKVPTLFLCLLARWRSGKLFTPLAAALGQCPSHWAGGDSAAVVSGKERNWYEAR